ncbi:MAG: polyprenyl synthetase family protein [Chthonomonadaceae bacterium]|nr:polyprenyl synthetase family protein [Chthonomonadaceae bacterium]
MSVTLFPTATYPATTPRRQPVRSGASSSSADFLSLVRSDLEAVEARMASDLGSEGRIVYTLTQHVMNAGGKRLRPAMVALSARAINPEISPERLATVGAAVEFVHMATLMHDDVVDNTATRRGKPTANAIFGNGVAVLSGDYILARAMRLLSMDGDLRIIRTVSEITIDMSEGEVIEISATGDANLLEETYLEILRKKTAVFVEGCCRCGAILAGATESQEAALADYGYRLGMAFQLADDLLDYTGDPAITGKPRGSDLKDGRATLPFMLALGEATEEERNTLLTSFGNADLEDAGVVRVCAILERYGAFTRTREVASTYVEQSTKALALLPDSPARDSFLQLTDYVIQRDR